MTLTNSQRLALRYDHHLSVTANAGSGKTMVLIERYLSVLLNGAATVPEVVVLTFTKKAAGELQRRIADRVEETCADAGDRVQRERANVIRQQLASANICTIDAFCTRVLREHPVEADVDAAFAVIEGVDQQILLQESIKETFQSVLGGSDKDDLVQVLHLIGKSKVLRTIEVLTLKREQMERLTGENGLYAKPDGEILEFWRNHLISIIEGELRAPQLTLDLKRIIAAATGRNARDVQEWFRGFLNSNNTTEMVRAYHHMMGGMLTKDGDLRKAFIGVEGEGGLVEEVDRVSAVNKMLLPVLHIALDSTGNEGHATLLRVTRCLLSIYQEVVRRYDEKKRDAGQLDFEDLQMRTKNLFRHEGVRNRLAQRYKYIMVDEYQDTNLLQYEILLPLLRDLVHGNLFIVGDPKQSIYGFRNADVSVFERTGKDIVRASGDEGAIVLGESFRPLRDVAAFVNMLFSTLMTAGNDDNIFYDPLVKARSNGSTGRVELLLRGAGVADDDTSSEGDCIARRILELFHSRHTVFDKHESPRALSFGDVAILLRSRTPLPEIERSLVRYNIPYVVSGGIGYFQTQDTYDFFNYFRFLLNPADDISLVGILRSPFFGVSDAELFEVSGNRRTTSLWEYLASPDSPAPSIPSLRHAIVVLRADLVAGLRLPVPGLIERILEQTSYAGKIAGSVRGKQSMANLEKLQQLARRYEARGFTNLFDFVRRLKRLIEKEETEGQGTIDSQGDAVQIMTIHASKGLEFPVVVVPALEKPFRKDEKPYMNDLFGIGISVGEASETETPITGYLKQVSHRKSNAEEQRVFYVACTRARDMLILSGLDTGKRGPPNYLTWLLDSLGSSGPGCLEYSVATRTLHFDMKGNAVEGIEKHTLPIYVLRPSDIPPQTKYQPGRESSGESPAIRIEAIEGQTKGEVFSATQLRTWLECPAKYYFRYVLGLPERKHQGEKSQSPPIEIQDYAGDVRGKIFHAVMEKIDKVGGSEALILDEARTQASLLLLPESSQEAGYIQETVAMVRRVIRSPFWKTVSDGTGAKTEFSLTCSLGREYVTGSIDRIYRDASGVWNVLDYKTDEVAADGIARRAQFYESQVALYALLVHRFFSAPTVRTNILFTNHVEEPVQRLFTSKELLEFQSKIEGIIERIRKSEFQHSSEQCSGCPFFPSRCPELGFSK